MIDLSADKARIFRITHVQNVRWILRNGVHCRNSGVSDPNFVSIGSEELITKRTTRAVPIPPFGTLSDYVPFYFTPKSIMLYNILTGYNGVRRRDREDIVMIVSSLKHLRERDRSFVFSDRHAYLLTANFSTDLTELPKLAWSNWRNADFKNDPERPEKKEMYQAEALVHRNLGMTDLLGFATASPRSRDALMRVVEDAGVDIRVIAQPSWYF